MIKNQRSAQIATYIHRYFPKLLTAILTITELGTRIYIECCLRNDGSVPYVYVKVYINILYIYILRDGLFFT